jgi:hypothetical protein
MPQLKQKPKLTSLNLRHRTSKDRYKKTGPPNNTERTLVLSLKIQKHRKKKAFIDNIDLQKLIALEQTHKDKEIKNNPQRLWKLSEDKSTLLLL